MQKVKRGLSILLIVCLLLSVSPANATAGVCTPTFRQVSNALIPQEDAADAILPEESVEPHFADDEIIRVFIVLDEPSVIAEGYSTQGLAANSGAMAYADSLETRQAQVASVISREVLSGEELDVRWNLTLATNTMSANVRYGDLDAIRKIPGVKSVYPVPVYALDDPIETAEPNTISAGVMVGSHDAWLDGYTGAGSLIAVIDTGVDTDHPSFNPDAFHYSLLSTAVREGKTVEDYDLLTVGDIAAVLPELNCFAIRSNLTAEDFYLNEKIAFGFNYIDEDLNVTHDLDSQGDHGTHVSGIATANRYVKTVSAGNTTYAYADNGVVGVAPDAQLVSMKVFGAGSGAYTDDYIAAIEDAVMLGCDAVNLSLGSANVGFTTGSEDFVDQVMDALVNSDTVVSISAGNSGYWAEYSKSPTGLTYTEDANTGRVGSPGSYTNSLAVASADNIGRTGNYFTVNQENYVYTDYFGTFHQLDASAGGTGTIYDYIFLGDPTNEEDTVKYGGTAEDLSTIDVTGKLVLISRGGGISFTDKQRNAMDAGAAGVIVYNNTPGLLNMSVGYRTPCVAIRLKQMESILAASQQNEAGAYVGKLTVTSQVTTDLEATEGALTMSVFSSWGVPGDLSLKPEITAPGGDIYSTRDRGTYGTMSGTSMAAPAIAGMAALVAQYIKENDLHQQENLTVRALAQSLLMGTAIPTMDPNTGVEYSPRSQGAGLAHVGNAVTSPTYITVSGCDDGKVKAELGDDPQRTGVYTFTFQVNNLTDHPVTYALEESVMAPMVVEQDGDTFAAMSNVTLGADTAYTGIVFDLSGDGITTEADVMLLLRHITGTEPLPVELLETADLDGNGSIEAVDAQILRTLVQGGTYRGQTLAQYQDMSRFTVPAHDTVEITATIALNDHGRSYLEDNFLNGTYVEGYIYLRSEAHEDGALGIDQSIPFLAFYGCWTDPTMFDRMIYAEHYAEMQEHAPYVSILGNYTKVRYRGSAGYSIQGQNRYAAAAEEPFARWALSSTQGDILEGFCYCLTRNAASLVYTVTDADTGEVYLEQDYGPQYGAFFYTNAQTWYNTSASVSINYALTDKNGAPLPNNTRLILALTAAPEYNVAKDGTISGLGKGAVWSMPLVIDNEAPELYTLEYVSDALTGEKYLDMVIEDNQHIAIVRVYDETGRTCLKYDSPTGQGEAGQRFRFTMDVSEIYKDTVLIQVMDYAGNASTYSLDLGNGKDPEEDDSDIRSGFFAYHSVYKKWVNFDAETANKPESIINAEAAFTAAEYAGGYIFGVDTGGYFHVLTFDDYVGGPVCKLDYTLLDMTYNKKDQKLYGLTYTTGLNEKGEPVEYGNAIITIDPLSGKTTLLGHVDTGEDGAMLQTLACRSDGVFFGISNSTTNAGLYSFTVADGQLSDASCIGQTGYKCKYLQSMAFDHTTDTLYWAQYYSASNRNLLQVDTRTAETTKLSALNGELIGLHVVAGRDSGVVGDDEIRVQLIQETLEMYSGTIATLEAYVMPWNLKNQGILWSSTDPAVATVNDSGMITAHKSGTTMITAAAAADPTKTASCTVTVYELNTSISGLIHDARGKEYFASIDGDDASFHKTSPATENEYISAVSVGQQLYAATDSALYAIDEDNDFQATLVCSTAAAFTDLAYSPELDVILATSGTNLVMVDLTAEGAVAGYWDLESEIAGVTYAGHDSYYNYFYVLETSGAINLMGLRFIANKYQLTAIGHINVSAYSVRGQTGNQSLHYDGNGWIYWARYDGESNSSLIAINEKTGLIVPRGNFGSEGSPVVGLYGAQIDTDRTNDFITWEAASFDTSAFRQRPIEMTAVTFRDR